MRMYIAKNTQYTHFVIFLSHYTLCVSHTLSIAPLSLSLYCLYHFLSLFYLSLCFFLLSLYHFCFFLLSLYHFVSFSSLSFFLSFFLSFSFSLSLSFLQPSFVPWLQLVAGVGSPETEHNEYATPKNAQKSVYLWRNIFDGRWLQRKDNKGKM